MTAPKTKVIMVPNPASSLETVQKAWRTEFSQSSWNNNYNGYFFAGKCGNNFLGIFKFRLYSNGVLLKDYVTNIMEEYEATYWDSNKDKNVTYTAVRYYLDFD